LSDARAVGGCNNRAGSSCVLVALKLPIGPSVQLVDERPYAVDTVLVNCPRARERLKCASFEPITDTPGHFLPILACTRLSFPVSLVPAAVPLRAVLPGRPFYPVRHKTVVCWRTSSLSLVTASITIDATAAPAVGRDRISGALPGPNEMTRERLSSPRDKALGVRFRRPRPNPPLTDGRDGRIENVIEARVAHRRGTRSRRRHAGDHDTTAGQVPRFATNPRRERSAGSTHSCRKSTTRSSPNRRASPSVALPLSRALPDVPRFRRARAGQSNPS